MLFSALLTKHYTCMYSKQRIKFHNHTLSKINKLKELVRTFMYQISLH